MRIDLNSDLGESFGPWPMGHDAALMPSVTSANIACGFHAGDPSVMRRTLALADSHGVSVGAHPGFPDLVGFGRREMHASPRDVEDMVLYQVAALGGLAQAAGMTLQHVKAHGALYTMACRDPHLADAIARAVAAFDRSLMLLSLPGSRLLEAGDRAGLRTVAEGFADRAYEPDGTLMSRRKSGSVIDDVEVVVTRAVRMARDRQVMAADGSVIDLPVETICLHGDTPGAANLAKEVRAGLERAGIRVLSLRTGL
ncbi:MAG: LamB/YcsF family protein [Acidobacteria bacterium]|nr:LamB/YcsF family protein [Acidobacteriota bacterium]